MKRIMAYRVHDIGKWLTVGIDPNARGGAFYPQAFAILKLDWPRRFRVFRLPLTLPHVSFAAAYRLRRVGALRLYSLCQRFYYWIGR